MSRHQAILLVGPTGSGKTPLGEHLERAGLWGRRCFHFDFGANLRQAAAGGGRLPASDVQVIRHSLATGALLENEDFPIAARILENFWRMCGAREGDLLVLNGMPRHVGQAEDVGRIVDLLAVVVLECEAETVRERIRVNAGGDRAGRVDDSPEAVAGKLKTFVERTRPLLDHYRSKGVRVDVMRIGVDTRPEAIAGWMEDRAG